MIRKKYSINIDRFDLLLFALLCLFLYSAVLSQDKLRAGIEYAGIFYLFCVYYTAKQLNARMGLWWRVLIFWALIAFVVSMVGIFGYFGTVLGNWQNPFVKKYLFGSFLGPRLTSTFTNPNMLASYLHIGLIFGVILLKRAQELKQRTVCSYVLIIACLTACILAKTRVLAGILFSLSLILFRFQPQKSRLLLWCRRIIPAIFVLVVLIVIANTIWWIFPLDIKINQQVLNVKINLTHFPYYSYDRAALAMVSDHPVFGVGMGQYNSNLKKYIEKKELINSFHLAYPECEIGEDPHTPYILKEGCDPHSTYFGWAAETGLAGLCLIISMFLYYCLRMTRYFKKETNGFNKYVAWCFFAGVCGFLLNGF
ncbi:O-antigen ligase family protein, partial [Candidatus Omnitrophota bacterium]